ncbi:MAG TPA: alpha/beta fold hydrolase, partial [Kiritimatiellae bacterium]|nr:alpha/beta fold hydrolase [Kiritimatiellia bacterium]
MSNRKQISVEKPVTFTSQAQQILGVLHLPPAASPCPAVLFFHGFTGSKHEAHRLFVTTARELARRGIASLRFDFRGAGDSAGDFHRMCLSSMLQDARAALTFLKNQPEVERRLIGLLGYSLGGLVAQLFLPQARNVRCCVLWAPVCDPRAAVARRASTTPAVRMALRGVADMDGWPVGRPLVVEMQTARPLKRVIR